jgi:hypothetical protein
MRTVVEPNISEAIETSVLSSSTRLDSRWEAALHAVCNTGEATIIVGLLKGAVSRWPLSK